MVSGISINPTKRKGLINQEVVMADLHAHVQIQYTLDNGGTVESYEGFDPTSEKSRKFVHDMLDEYLDYLRARIMGFSQGKGVKEALSEENHFKVFDYLDGDE